MHTGLLGVIERELPDVPIPVRVTSIERTLIDIAVRPAYAGGTQAVLNAYQQASRDVDVQTLINLLDKIKYIYPYHQSIGFYMEHSGCYSPEQMELIRCIPRHYNFYLDYEIRDPSFDKTWRIFYPKSLDHALSL
jgi:hypothetical protein